jgi:hypothetical protein
MRGCGIPRGFWLKPGGSADRVDGIIIETLLYCANIVFIETLLYCANIIRKYTRPCGTHCNKQTNNKKYTLKLYWKCKILKSEWKNEIIDYPKTYNY